MFSNELARRYGSQGIVSTSCHPGLVRTEVQRHVPKVAAWLFVRPSANALVAAPDKCQHQDRLMKWDAPLGALTQLRAGTSPEAADWNGKACSPRFVMHDLMNRSQYLIPWAVIGEPSKASDDQTQWRELWAYMDEQTAHV